MRNTKSAQLFKRAKKVIPGGVNSPVRAFKAVGGSPIFIRKAKGPFLYDADGNRYIDYCLSWGPLILGHADKDVLRQVKTAISRGSSYGIPTESEIRLAETIASAFEAIDKVRLVSSGTEAVMTAIRLARGVTGRDKIVKFVGCYHGHADHMLVRAGSGLMTLGIPASPGVPKDFTKNTLLCPYNDSRTLNKIFIKFAGQIAAVIIEPVAGNMGTVLPVEDFLKKVRKICTQNNALLIFDEVITGFRLAYGGAQTIFNTKPDITTLGKIIGGGFPIGAVGGKAAIMDNLCPDGNIYQAGTLSGNPVCAAAGIATLRVLKTLNPYSRLDKLTRQLCEGISEILCRKGIEHRINRIGSMFTVFFTDRDVTDFNSASLSDTRRYARYFRQMLAGGIYLPPSQFEANFISTKHTQKHIASALSAVKRLRL